jgi:hypothetical protein
VLLLRVRSHFGFALLITFFSSDYSYYAFTSASPATSYGFNLSIYLLITNAADISLSYFLLRPGDGFIYLAWILAALSLIYSLLIGLFVVKPGVKAH